jgi:hypothetical protein
MEPRNRPFQNVSEMDWRRTESHTTSPDLKTAAHDAAAWEPREPQIGRVGITEDLAALRPPETRCRCDQEFVDMHLRGTNKLIKFPAVWCFSASLDL